MNIFEIYFTIFLYETYKEYKSRFTQDNFFY